MPALCRRGILRAGAGVCTCLSLMLLPFGWATIVCVAQIGFVLYECAQTRVEEAEGFHPEALPRVCKSWPQWARNQQAHHKNESRSAKVPDGGQMGLQRGNVPSVGYCLECAHQGACPERAGKCAGISMRQSRMNVL